MFYRLMMWNLDLPAETAIPYYFCKVSFCKRISINQLFTVETKNLEYMLMNFCFNVCERIHVDKFKKINYIWYNKAKNRTKDKVLIRRLLKCKPNFFPWLYKWKDVNSWFNKLDEGKLRWYMSGSKGDIYNYSQSTVIPYHKRPPCLFSIHSIFKFRIILIVSIAKAV